MIIYDTPYIIYHTPYKAYTNSAVNITNFRFRASETPWKNTRS